jgi:hypothetical protein
MPMLSGVQTGSQPNGSISGTPSDMPDAYHPLGDTLNNTSNPLIFQGLLPYPPPDAVTELLLRFTKGPWVQGN